MLKIQDFIDSKRDNVMALLNNGMQERAVMYVQAWTNCEEAEAQAVVESIAKSKAYELYLADVKQIEDYIHVRKEKEKHARTMTTSASAKTQKKKPVRTAVQKRSNNNLYLVDGDNHIKTAIEIVNSESKNKDTVRIFVSQSGLFEKLRKRQLTNSQIILVPPGDQAVDNRIKTELGNAVKQDYGKIFVISHDKGYDELIQKYHCQYHLNKKILDRIE